MPINRNLNTPVMNTGYHWGSGPLEPWQQTLNDRQTQARQSDADGAAVGMPSMTNAQIMPVLAEYAKSLGFTGKPKDAAQFLSGMIKEDGTWNSEWGYQQDHTMAPNVPLDAVTQVLRDQGKLDRFHSGFVGKDFFMNDLTGILLGAGMVAAPAASIAAAGAAGSGAAGAAGAGAVEGGALAGGAAGEYGLGGAAGSGIGGGSAGLGYGGAGGVETVGGIGTAGGSGAAVGSSLPGALGSGVAASGGITATELLSKIPSSVWSQGAQAVLKYIGMNKMGKAYEDAANQLFNRSAPYNNLLLASYGKDFNLANLPGYQGAFDRAADISTRAWSAKSGNPANNPGIQANILDDVWSKSYLPALSDYRAGLRGSASTGVDSATSALMNSIPYSQPALSAGGDFLGGILESLPKQQNDELTIGGVAYRG